LLTKKILECFLINLRVGIEIQHARRGISSAAMVFASRADTIVMALSIVTIDLTSSTAIDRG
jgi:hypothetical protein